MWRQNPNVKEILESGGIPELRRSIERLRHDVGASYEQIRRALELHPEVFWDMMWELEHGPVDRPGMRSKRTWARRRG